MPLKCHGFVFLVTENDSVFYLIFLQWSCINELNKLACLEEIRLKSNPIMNLATPETVRQLLIAKLKHIKLVNRTEVKS